VVGLAAALVVVLGGGGATYLMTGRPASTAAPSAAVPSAPAPVAVAQAVQVSGAAPADAGAPRAEAPAEPAAPVAPAAPAAPAEVTLRVTSEPEGAGVYRFVDSVLLGKTPYDHRVPVSTGSAVLVLKLDGHRDQRLEIPMAADTERHVKLEAAPSGEPGARGGRRKKSRFRSLGQ
jgi:hypothetical protein